MKKFFVAIGNFFKKIGLFIWKYLKIAFNYVKENAWLQPIVLVVLIFGLVFGIQGIVNAVDKAKENSSSETANGKDVFTKITYGEVESKLDNGDDFVLFIGSHNCYHCSQFKKVVNKYVSSTGKMIYYIDIDDTSDTTRDTNILLEWKEDLDEIATRDYDKEDSLSTPTTVVIRNGKFVDAKSGAIGLEGGDEYLNFTKFVEGEYIGKFE